MRVRVRDQIRAEFVGLFDQLPGYPRMSIFPGIAHMPWMPYDDPAPTVFDAQHAFTVMMPQRRSALPEGVEAVEQDVIVWNILPDGKLAESIRDHL